jgi:hypothetical protein
MEPLPKAPTDDVTQTITQFIRAGACPTVAAGSAGVRGKVFRRWMSRGSAPDAPEEFRRFREAVELAWSQTRLQAETEVRKNKPLDWLRYGPAKGNTRHPGWTSAGKFMPRRRSRVNPFLFPRVQAVFALLLKALIPFPEARAAAASVLTAASVLRDGVHRRSSEHIDT